jgi:hypothetical protein
LYNSLRTVGEAGTIEFDVDLRCHIIHSGLFLAFVFLYSAQLNEIS